MTEERLRQAAREAGRVIAEALPAPEDCPHEFSPEFERKMRRLLRREKHKGLYTALRRVACVLVVLLLSCGTWLSVDAQAREAFFGWAHQLTQGARHYFFSGDPAQEDSPTSYYLPEIPEGYSEFQINRTEHGASMLYANDEWFFSFGYQKQKTVSTTSDIFFLRDDSPQTVYVNGIAADFYADEGEDGNLLVWHDREGTVLFYIDAHLSMDEIIRLAESVQQES